MNQLDTVAIVGVGMMGGSIGKSLIERKIANRVVGIGRRTASLEAAAQARAVTSTTTDLVNGVKQAELIIVCTPVEMIAQQVREIAQACPAGALITDVGSTKAEIVAEIGADLGRGVRFLGSHPLAGGEKLGVAHARSDLLDGRTVVICPSATSAERDTAERDIGLLSDFWAALGADVRSMTPEEHDRALAATSHLPHVVSAALAASTGDDDLQLTSTGWFDTTRIAAGDPALWRSIFDSNRANVLKALARFEKTLGSLRSALERSDDDELLKILEKAKQNRDAVGS